MAGLANEFRGFVLVCGLGPPTVSGLLVQWAVLCI